MRKGVKGDAEEEKERVEGEEGERGSRRSRRRRRRRGECFLTGTRMQRQVHLPTAAQPLLLDAMRSLKPSKRLSDNIWDSTQNTHTYI